MGSSYWLCLTVMCHCGFGSARCGAGVPAASGGAQQLEDWGKRREFKQRGGWRRWRGGTGGGCQWRRRGGTDCFSPTTVHLKHPFNWVYVRCVQEEVEPFPEERENFLQQLYKFMEDRGEPHCRQELEGFNKPAHTKCVTLSYCAVIKIFQPFCEDIYICHKTIKTFSGAKHPLVYNVQMSVYWGLKTGLDSGCCSLGIKVNSF